MGEPDRAGCGELADTAAELALGALTGRERAEALAHLDRCTACREHVRRLTMTGEELLGLLAGIEPPPGFETQVMERIGLCARDPSLSADGRIRRLRRPAREPGYTVRGRTRRMLTAAAVTLTAAMGVLGGWGMRAALAPAGSLLSSAALVSASRQPAGTIFVYSGSPEWLYMSVDLPSGNGAVVCQVVGADGHVSAVGSFRLANGYGSWGSPGRTDIGPLVGARLISSDGAVLATASFPRPAR
jgi:anti-sigma factor RsiW